MRLPALLLAAGLFAPSVAAAQPQGEVGGPWAADADRDGRITRDEMRAYMERRFGLMDPDGDGLVPVSMLGSERFFYDEAARTLDSEHGRVSYSVGQRLDLRLMEANPVSGALRFELPDAPEGGFRNRPPRRDGMKKAGKHAVGKRGRPGNIRHQGKRR